MLGDRIKACRKSQKISQMALAETLNVSQAAITAWERGARKPDIDTVARMADLFGISTDYLLGRCDEPYFNHTLPSNSVILSTTKEPPEQMPGESTMRMDLGPIDDLPRNRKQLEQLVSSMIEKALGGHRTNQ